MKGQGKKVAAPPTAVPETPPAGPDGVDPGRRGGVVDLASVRARRAVTEGGTTSEGPNLLVGLTRLARLRDGDVLPPAP